MIILKLNGIIVVLEYDEPFLIQLHMRGINPAKNRNL